jgi:Pyruvate/2-oxoacid:ferredoxin oxidoreductase delta subunit
MPMNDRGLVTDATGEGMYGATDVSFQTQQELKKTAYNGSKACKGCGIYSDLCPTCTKRKAHKHVKGGMA